MKKFIVLTTSIIFLAVSACGKSTEKNSLAADSTTNLIATSANISAQLTSEVELTDTYAGSVDGWLYLSFNASASGTASVAISYGGYQREKLSLSFKEGRGSVVISPNYKAMKKGNVSGKRTFVCGPQGATCTEDLPELTTTEISYPCGPQGAMCRITLPAAILD